MPRERARAPVLDYSEPSRAEISRPDGEKLAVATLFEGTDTFFVRPNEKIEKKKKAKYK